jgi:hypothetical protein
MSASAIYETPIEFKSRTLSGLRFTVLSSALSKVKTAKAARTSGCDCYHGNG